MAQQILACYAGKEVCSSIVPRQGFLLGIAPAGWQNACGGPRVSIPGRAGCVSVTVSQPWDGGIAKGIKGPGAVRVCNPGAQITGWTVRPRVVTVRAHRLHTASSQNEWAESSSSLFPTLPNLEALMLVILTLALRSASGSKRLPCS